MPALNIPNLHPITLVVAEEMPFDLTNDEIAELVMYPGARRDIKHAHDLLLEIQRWCQYAADTGRNKDLVGVEDFKVALIRTSNDRMNPTFVDAGDSIVFKHKETGRGQAFDAVPPAGFNSPAYHYATAHSLINLAKGVTSSV